MESKWFEFAVFALEQTKDAIREGVFEIDAEAMADKAVELGFIKMVKFDPDTHVGVDAEPGDEIYWFGGDAHQSNPQR